MASIAHYSYYFIQYIDSYELLCLLIQDVKAQGFQTKKFLSFKLEWKRSARYKVI